MEDKLFLDLIMQWVSIPYLAAFILFSYGFIKLSKIDKVRLNLFNKEIVIRKTYVVLVIAGLLGILFYFILEGEKNVVLVKIIMTYGLGTSLYDIFIKRLEQIFNKK